MLHKIKEVISKFNNKETNKKINNHYNDIYSSYGQSKNQEDILFENHEKNDFIARITNILNDIRILNSEQKQKINGYINNEKESILTFQNIIIIKNREYNKNISKHHILITDENNNIILKKTTTYDKNKEKIDFSYESTADWKDNLNNRILLIEQDIKEIKKENIMNKIKNHSAEFRNNNIKIKKHSPN